MLCWYSTSPIQQDFRWHHTRWHNRQVTLFLIINSVLYGAFMGLRTKDWVVVVMPYDNNFLKQNRTKNRCEKWNKTCLAKPQTQNLVNLPSAFTTIVPITPLWVWILFRVSSTSACNDTLASTLGGKTDKNSVVLACGGTCYPVKVSIWCIREWDR